MPTLTVRIVGMSALVEGLDAPGLDGAGLLAALGEDFGPAVAPMGAADAATGAPQALIVDRRAADWDALRQRLEAWVRGRGFGYAAWSEAAMPPGQQATLHFHP